MSEGPKPAGGAAGHRILYDADCGFCRWSLAWILRWDRHRRLEPLSIQESADLLAGVDAELHLASWHLVEPDGTLTSGGRAAIPMLRLLPGGRAPAVLAARVPGIVDRAYMLVARNRSRISRWIGERAKARADHLLAERRRAR